MAGAKIHSLDAIKQFRTALIKFAEQVNSALGNADSDVNRSQSWLEMEARPYWQSQIRKRQMALAAALEALRMKEVFKSSDGTTQSVVDEKKAVQVAKQRLEIANQKLAATQKYLNIMQKESVLYKGSVQRFSSTVQSTPVAVAQLGRVMDAIDRYFAANPEVGVGGGVTNSETGRPNYLEFLAPVTRTEEESPDKLAEENAAPAEAVVETQPVVPEAPKEQP